MSAFDFTEIEFHKIITHHIGNKLRDEGYLLSSDISAIDGATTEILLKYFILPLKQEELFTFTHPVNIEMNEIYALASDLFARHELAFIETSQSIAKLLYENSQHPKIKEGEFNVVYFRNVCYNGTYTDAIGLFKSETSVPFLKMNGKDNHYFINHDYGFDVKGIDKGCLILNANQDNGYIVLILDNANKFGETRYWKDAFLNVKPLSDDYFQTNEFLTITKQFVSKELLKDEYNIDKADQIDLLNRSVDYFKSHDTFDRLDFENTIFQNYEVIESFRRFDDVYRENKQIELNNQFDISAKAVKKQARAFKSVLKLDKNFHIYIHGDRNMIEQGIDNDGRKFYKIYYQEEN